MKDAYIVTNHKLKSASIYFIEIMLQSITMAAEPPFVLPKLLIVRHLPLSIKVSISYDVNISGLLRPFS